MDEAVDNNGVPLVGGVELGVDSLLQKPLGLVQGGLQADAQAQKPVPGGGPPPEEDLVDIDLAHPRLLGQSGLGNGFVPIQISRQFNDRPVQKEILVGLDIGADVGLTHQLLLQLVGGFLLYPFTSVLLLVINLYNSIQVFPAKNNMPAA